jgi:long-chain acyl-CoA synthetase
MEQACFAYDMITVPLYDTLGEEACHFIIEQTQIHLILVDECEKAISLVVACVLCDHVLLHRTVVDQESEQTSTISSRDRRVH